MPNDRWCHDHRALIAPAVPPASAVTFPERFNRARYDAGLTVTAFASRLKDPVDLGSVRDDLVTVVQAALEPAHAPVWTNERGR